MDEFQWFCLANQDKEYLSPWISPSNETSIFKQIPIAELDRVKSLTRRLGLNPRIVYRGPRRRQIDPSFTRKRDAERFTVYLR